MTRIADSNGVAAVAIGEKVLVSPDVKPVMMTLREKIVERDRGSRVLVSFCRC